MKVIAIDQSLTASALCGLDDGKQFLLETIRHDDSVKGAERIVRILDHVRTILTEHKPLIFAMEDYSGGANINTLIPLVELGGCIKLLAHELGYRPGRELIMQGRSVLMVNSPQTMKKFMLGEGNVKKDTSYLLKVHQRLKVAFDDDNKADAYMHAQMVGLMYKVIRGEIPVSNLTNAQQEALITPGVKRKSGLSIIKAMKLPDDQKLALAGF